MYNTNIFNRSVLLVFNRSVLLAVMLAAPSFASTPDVCLENPSSAVQVQSPVQKELSPEDRSKLKRSMETDSVLQHFLQEEARAPIATTLKSPLSKNEIALGTIQESFSKAMDYHLTPSTLENFPGIIGLVEGSGAGLYYLGDKRAAKPGAIYKDLIVQQDLARKIHLFLEGQAKNDFQGKYDALQLSWSKLLEAFQHGCMSDTGAALENCNKLRKAFGDELARSNDLLILYEYQCSQIRTLLAQVVDIHTELNKLTEAESFTSFNREYAALIGKVRLLVKNHKSTTMAEMAAPLAGKGAKKSQTAGQIESLASAATELYDRVVKELRPAPSNSNVATPAAVTKQETSPKSGRAFAESLAVATKVKEKKKGTADPARAAAAVKKATPKAASPEADIEVAKTYTAWNQEKFDQWLTEVGEENRERILEEVRTMAKGGKPKDVRCLSRGKFDGKTITFQELRFFLGESQYLRVYGVMHDGQYYVLNWGGKNNQTSDIETAVTRIKELMSASKKQEYNAKKSNKGQ